MRGVGLRLDEDLAEAVDTTNFLLLSRPKR
jgi:hypothetical protein